MPFAGKCGDASFSIEIDNVSGALLSAMIENGGAFPVVLELESFSMLVPPGKSQTRTLPANLKPETDKQYEKSDRRKQSSRDFEFRFGSVTRGNQNK